MTRREFIALAGGVITWPSAARAQKVARLRKIGVLMPFRRSDHIAQRFFDALEPGGYLFLGHSESLSKMPVKFQAIVLGDCILYRKPTAEELQKPELVTEGRA